MPVKCPANVIDSSPACACLSQHACDAAIASIPGPVRVARTHLRSDRLAIVVVGDAEQITEPLRTLGVGPVEVHRVE